MYDKDERTPRLGPYTRRLLICFHCWIIFLYSFILTGCQAPYRLCRMTQGCILEGCEHSTFGRPGFDSNLVECCHGILLDVLLPFAGQHFATSLGRVLNLLDFMFDEKALSHKSTGYAIVGLAHELSQRENSLALVQKLGQSSIPHPLHWQRDVDLPTSTTRCFPDQMYAQTLGYHRSESEKFSLRATLA